MRGKRTDYMYYKLESKPIGAKNFNDGVRWPQSLLVVKCECRGDQTLLFAIIVTVRLDR